MPFPTPEERVGTRAGDKYDLLRICGRGGMGVLFEGVHALTGRRVAVKFFYPRGAHGKEEVARFLREARTATTVRHPNVVEVFDVGSDGQWPFIVMEYLEGETLADRLERESRLAVSSCLSLLLPILEALAVAHERGVVHRDIKPANIFLTREGAGPLVPKLLDFGVAKSNDTEAVTADGTVLGTPGYMSPEQAQGDVVGPASDVWAMGVVLFRCLTGVLPFDGVTSARILMNVLSNRIRPMNELDPELPPRLCAIVERALRLDREARYASMRAFAEALRITASEGGIVLRAPELSLPVFERSPEATDGQTLSVEVPANANIRHAPLTVPVSLLRRLSRKPAARRVLGAAGIVASLAFMTTLAAPLRPSTPPKAAAPARSPITSAASTTTVEEPRQLEAAAPPTSSAPLLREHRKLHVQGRRSAVSPSTVPKIRTEW